MRKLLLALLVLTLFATACGDDSDSEPDTSGDDSAADDGDDMAEDDGDDMAEDDGDDMAEDEAATAVWTVNIPKMSSSRPCRAN